jgi:hypothetical protein
LEGQGPARGVHGLLLLRLVHVPAASFDKLLGALHLPFKPGPMQHATMAHHRPVLMLVL